ncbi:hypothetical protein HY988_00610 [Candidatus Micrarchaeota archaeon]|nr:hypothetical protein [Candidatus Micrarchaeota archaeon]
MLRIQMRLILILTFIFSILLTLSYAAENVTSDGVLKFSPAFNKNLSIIFNQIKDTLGEREITKSVAEQQMIIVKGEEISIMEQELLSSAKKKYPILNSVKAITAKSVHLEELLKSKKVIILVGGPNKNSITEQITKKDLIFNNTARSNSFLVKSTTLRSGQTVVIFSDLRGYKNIKMQARHKSPLVTLGLSPDYVPLVASAISSALLLLWPNILIISGTFLKVYSAGFLKSKAKEKTSIEEVAEHANKFGFTIRLKEILGLLIATLVYGIAVSYAFTGLEVDFEILFYAIIFAGALFSLRTVIRFLFERFFKLKSVFSLWKEGCGICLVSAVLGNTLQTTGYELEEANTENQKKLALMKFSITFITMLLAVIIFFINLESPDKILQVFIAIASGLAFTEVIPIAPMPGAAIKKWNLWVWCIIFILIVATYFLINFYL